MYLNIVILITKAHCFGSLYSSPVLSVVKELFVHNFMPTWPNYC